MNAGKRSALTGHSLGRYVHDLSLVILFSSLFSVLPLELNPQFGITSEFFFPFLIDWNVVALANIFSIATYCAVMFWQYQKEVREARLKRLGSAAFDPADFGGEIRLN